jgi:hypothetical protein
MRPTDAVRFLRENSRPQRPSRAQHQVNAPPPCVAICQMLTTIVFHGPPLTQTSQNSKWMSGRTHPTGNQTVLVETGTHSRRWRRRALEQSASACTAEARGSNPLRSTNHTIDITVLLYSRNIADKSGTCARKVQ